MSGSGPSSGPAARPVARPVAALGRATGGLARITRGLQVDADAPGPVARVLRGVLFVLLFSPWYAAVAICARLGVVVEVDGESATGVRFRLRPPDLVQTYICLFGTWEPDVTAFIRHRLRPGDGFVDVGANVGYYALEASRLVGPGGRVVAVEASPTIYRRLDDSIARNAFATNVRAVNKAVASKVGTMQVLRGPAHNLGLTSTVRHRRARRWAVETEIETLPLADVLQPDELGEVKLVKVDVEGAEDEVLAGMGSFLDRCRDDVEILVELSPAWWSDPSTRPIDVLRPFFDAGFCAYEIENDYWPWRYLWPRSVSPPRRLRGELTDRVKRIDLVLSRVDDEVLR